MQNHLALDGSPHGSDDQLELYALDRLSETEIIPLEEHLMVCEACREKLEQVAAFAFTVRDVLKQHPVPAADAAPSWLDRLQSTWSVFSPGNWRPQMALAGAFAAVVLSVGVWQVSKTDGSMTLPAVASLQLTAMRGEMPSVPPARELELQLGDAPETGAPFRLELVSDTGSPVWTGQPAASQVLSARINKPVTAGVYFLRLYDNGGKLLHEYGFRVMPPPAKP